MDYIICPRCGTDPVRYRDIVIQVDAELVFRNNEGKLDHDETNYQSDYWDVGDFSTQLANLYGSVSCESCGSIWPNLEAVDEEIRRKEAEANRPPFGVLNITSF